jgi:hypothetical protein
MGNRVLRPLTALQLAVLINQWQDKSVEKLYLLNPINIKLLNVAVKTDDY